jgi:serine/threonine-protein kinase
MDGALDLPPPARSPYLDDACAGDADLRREVEALLAASATGPFLATPAAVRAAPLLAEAAAGDDHPPAPPGGRVVGPYRLREALGEGGMGAVYLAERADGQFEQQVAVKLLRHGLHGEESRLRFLRERQILARLAHPSISRLLDGGVTEDGTPFFVMERIDGKPVTTACDERRLGVDARLAIFLRVCEAVQYAHANLVVHRDLKPSNILVDRAGTVKLLDFGIAKLLADEEGGAEATRTRLRALTPEYAAPEQVRGDPVTTATDVYALGVLLYELLTGERPYRIERGAALAWDWAVLEREPARPSACGGSLPGIGARELGRRLRGDLDLIVLRALQEEPARRYASAEALAADVRRHVAGLPVAVRGDALAYRARKFVRRHRAGVVAAALVLLSLLTGLLGTAWQARRAFGEAEKAAAVKDFLKSLFSAADPTQAQGRERTARELLEDGARRIETEFRDQPEVQSEVARLIASVYVQLGEYDRARALLEGDLERRRRLDGPRSVAVAESLEGLAEVAWEQGRYRESGVMAQEALSIREAGSGEATAAVAGLVWRIGEVRRQEGDLGAAEALQKRALGIYVRTKGDDSREANTVRRSLAIVYDDAGRFAEAAPLDEAVAAWHERHDGPDHPDTLTARFDQAVGLLTLGRPDQAVAVAEDVVARQRKVLGGRHDDLALSLRLLARALDALGRSEDALPRIAEAMAIHLDRFGPRHRQVAMDRAWQALIEAHTPRLTEAQADIEEAFRGLEAAGSSPVNMAAMTAYVGVVLAEAGRLEEGDAYLGRAVSSYRAQNELRTPLGRALDSLGDVARRRRQPARAAEIGLEALAVLERAAGPQHPATALARVRAGASLWAGGRAAEGERLLREGLEVLERTFPAGHFDLATARLLLGEALAGSGRGPEARRLLQAALEWREEHLGAADPRTVAVRRALRGLTAE